MSELENIVAELSIEEMGQVSGGYKKPPAKPGYKIYKIVKGDTLHGIAKKNRCTVADIMRWNPKITDKNKIYYDDYIYLLEK